MQNIFQTKPLIDKYFKDNWTKTPIQYDGADFEAKTTSWISVALVPMDRQITSFDGQDGRKSEEGIIRVRCYDTSATKVYSLNFDVLTLLECKEFDGLRVGVGTPDGSGAVPLDNGVYESQIDFIVKVIK